MSTTDPTKQALLDRAASLVWKTSAAAVLWKYTDDEGKEFYLPEKKMGTLKSPYSGKSFSVKPEKSSLSDVGKELKEEDAKVKGALFKYTDDEGKEFYLPARLTGTLKSPYSGKSFSPKAEKSTLTDVSKELKGKGKEEKGKEASVKEVSAQTTVRATSPEQWEGAAEILDWGADHPAIKVLSDQFEKILGGIKEAAVRSARMKKIGVGRTEDPTFVLVHVMPEVKKLGEKAILVAKQMEQRYK